ncbi:helix-turn-helix domain-containing protein [Nonomuraea sp. NPDC050663]|uniref:helix-turn-helix domain-containing protein n=1 Tax=Nonomuraea sp. NPDC050663 TaxID=3364370 RepID=UPI0037B91337
MRDLIGKLEAVGDETAGALRVIAHFDSLVEQRAPVAAVIRAAAVLAGCPAGYHDAGRSLTRRYDPKGRSMAADAPRSWPQVAVPGRPGCCLWLEREGERRPLDALILERAALAVHALTGERTHRSIGEAVKIACDPDASEAERRDAIARLGLTGPTTVVVSGSGEGVLSPSTALVGELVVTLVAGAPVYPSGLRAGTAVAAEPAHLPAALDHARLALRLTDRLEGPGASLVHYDDLGALAVVAERITPDEAGALDDVRRIDQARATRPWAVDTLQAVLDHSSLRQAAAVLHLHHSTLQERLTSLASQLGYSLTRPGGRQRAAVAVLLWRIAHCADG